MLLVSLLLFYFLFVDLLCFVVVILCAIVLIQNYWYFINHQIVEFEFHNLSVSMLLCLYIDRKTETEREKKRGRDLSKTLRKRLTDRSRTLEIWCVLQVRLIDNPEHSWRLNIGLCDEIATNRGEYTTMSLYCWGSTSNGELGLGGIEEEQVHFLLSILMWIEI